MISANKTLYTGCYGLDRSTLYITFIHIEAYLALTIAAYSKTLGLILCLRKSKDII